MRIVEPGSMPTTLGADAFLGQYTWYDDGWAGGMRLWTAGPGELAGRYTSYRFGTSHLVSARIGGPPQHEIRLDIHDFNGLESQRFTGYPADPTGALVAGVTEWRDERYGFYAHRAAPRALPAFRGGDTVPADFAGLWMLRRGGGPATVELVHDGGRRLAGQWRRRDGGPAAVEGEIDPEDPLLVRLTLRDPGGDAALTGRLFSRPKNVVAGWVDAGPARTGCYLVRIR